MAEAAFSIKLRCASWPQLATIYRRDLSRGQMFLKASTQPPIGTVVRIDLELPSATVIELQGTIFEHVTDPQRGTGVNLKLDALPTKTVWMIESALAAENKVRAASQSDATPPPAEASAAPSATDGEEVAAAEAELIRALEAEAESLRKLNPFLVHGVGYETSDGDVRAAFGELTKRYHPDRFVRYQSQKLRQIAAEIFILIRDAYRRLADEKGRQHVLAALGPKTPTRTPTPPRGAAVVPEKRPSEKMPALTPPPVPKPGPQPSRAVSVPIPPTPPKPSPQEVPTAQTPYDAPTNPSAKSAELAHTELARADLAVPHEKPVSPSALANQARPLAPIAQLPASQTTGSLPRKSAAASAEIDTSAIETMIDAAQLDEAINAYRVQLKRNPQDKGMRAGIELVEGLKALAARDRLEAAQRFEAALELDPSNERAARELAEMRRQATNERKGLLSRLMGKKEP
jgi:tetratricopeptide (TPR) repeat protein